MKIVCLIFLGLVMTASQSHCRQSGAAYPYLCLFNCRGQAPDAGRLSAPCPRVRVRRGSTTPTCFSAGLR